MGLSVGKTQLERMAKATLAAADDDCTNKVVLQADALLGSVSSCFFHHSNLST